MTQPILTLSLSSLAACLLPVMAVADCPTRADLAKGIRFDISGGEAEIFAEFSPNTLQATYFTEGQALTRILLARGLYVTEIVDIVDGEIDMDTRLTYAYETPLADLALPEPGAVITVTSVENDRGSFTSKFDQYTVGAKTTVSFGACTYDMIPVEQRYDENDPSAVDYLHWLPELGLSYLTRSVYADGDDRYYYVGIEAVE